MGAFKGLVRMEPAQDARRPGGQDAGRKGQACMRANAEALALAGFSLFPLLLAVSCLGPVLASN